MKFLATVMMALWALPALSFSLVDLVELPSTDKAGGFIHWQGKGVKVNAPGGEDKQVPYLASLTMRDLGDHAILFQYRVVSSGHSGHPAPAFAEHFIAQVEDNGLFSVYVSKDDRQDVVADDEIIDLHGYRKSGWGHSVGASMYFDYITASGHHSMRHYRSYHDEQGNFRLASTGSLGTAEGLQFTWTEDIKRIFVHRP